MDHVIIDAGTLLFSEEDMTATGLLIPFGVEAHKPRSVHVRTWRHHHP